MAKRMFVAIELPEDIRNRLGAVASGLSGLKPVPAHQLHLTLAFLGNVAAENESALRDALSAIGPAEFPLTVHGLGTFGGSRKPMVLWTGVEDPGNALPPLAAAVRDAAQTAGIAIDERPFVPHITLGRRRGGSPAKLRIFLREYREETFGSFTVSGFTLFESVLSPDGPVHTPVLRVPGP